MAEFILNRQALRQVLEDPRGETGRWLVRKSIGVQNQAKRNLRGAGGRGLRAFDTGNLTNSITYEVAVTTSGLVARVGTNVPYALYVHEGTGIYGPRRQRIRPRNARALAFKWRDAPVATRSRDGRHYYKSVAGSPARPFLRRALEQEMAKP